MKVHEDKEGGVVRGKMWKRVNSKEKERKGREKGRENKRW